MINSRDLYADSCSKLDAFCIDAFFDLKLDEFDPTILILDNSWEETEVDLKPAIKAGETITHLSLTPTALQFNREDYGRDGVEDKGIDCIHGDDLSHILSMQYLKDVDQNTPVKDGDVYMYDGVLNVFKPYDLQATIGSLNQEITNLKEQVTTLQQSLKNLKQVVENNYTAVTNRLAIIEETIKRPDGIPTDTVLAWGNRNYYTDYTNTGLKTTGIFTHNTSILLPNDTKDA